VSRIRVGVDTGGTFSDFVFFDEESREMRILKVPSTPADPSQAVIDGMRERAASRGGEEITFFAHGTTVGTNAILELKGARTGLLVTAGFKGILEIGDQTRGYGAATYDLFWEKPALLAPRKWTGEVPERVGADGAVVVPLDEAATLAEIRRLRAQGVESLAVCLLFSFMNPAHERRVAELIQQEMPEASVSLSSEILPQIREYYRLSTTTINAYIGPILARYLANMERRLRDIAVATPQLYIMQSNGGVSTFGAAADRAVTTVLSGPAAGVIAGAHLSHLAGYDNVITFDMGGTSADLALVEAGTPVQTTQGQIAGRDIAVPILDINTISAGGGTIGWVDEVGMLRMGPQSAGADPGPACYGRGGAQPTVTDANVVLGYIDPDYFLGGSIRLDRAAAERAVRERVAAPLGMSLEAAADGMLRIVNTDMEQGIKAISSERGYDLRDFVLIAFGGAGPVAAGRLAAELGIPRVLVPIVPGATSAMGLLMSDVRRGYVRSRLGLVDRVDPAEANGLYAELREKAIAELTAEGFAAEEIGLEYYLDMRYAGQGYELTVPGVEVPVDAAQLGRLRERFDSLHERLHGHQAPAAPVEAVNYRLVAVVSVPKVELRTAEPSGEPVEAARAGARPVYFGELGRFVDCPVYDRTRLQPGHRLEGPAIVQQLDSTTVVYPGQSASVDRYLNLIVHIA